MKIEMGESLIMSWLRHSKGCQIVQTNWKPSLHAWELYNEALIDEIIEESQDYFLNEKGYDLFKKNSSTSQIIQQGEIDVLGMEINRSTISKIYAVDVAFHESGLNYGSKDETVTRVMKKMIRMACTVYGFFDVRSANIIFASPKIHNAVYEPLKEAVTEINNFVNKRWRLDYKFELICNDDFRDRIYYVVKELSNNVADTSELFMRSLQMQGMFERIYSKPVEYNNGTKKQTNSTRIKCPKLSNDYQIDDVYNEIKIGALVRSTLPKLFESREIPDEEVERLTSYEYSKQTFNVMYPVLKVIDESVSVRENRLDGEYSRYYAKPIIDFGGKRYLITQEWFDRSKPYYIKWLDSFK